MKYSREFGKFRKIEAWSMRELGFSTEEIGQELNCSIQATRQLINRAKNQKLVPPTHNYCEVIAPRYAKEATIIETHFS